MSEGFEPVRRALKDWSAKRVGATMTVYGTWSGGSLDGHRTRITAVETIVCMATGVRATREDGEVFDLVVPAP